MVTPALVWPGFDASTDAAERRVRRRLARAAETPLEAHSALDLAAHALGLAPLPEAALVRLAGGQEAAPDGYLAEPVMLRPDRDRLLLARLGEEALDADEARELVAAAHGHFGPGELRIEAAEDGPWHVRLPGQVARAGIPAARAERVPLEASPEHFGTGLAGMRVLNELQMLWYAHPVNAARRAAGRAQANALWVWGGGVLPEPARAEGLAGIAARDPALEGLARWLGVAATTPEAALAAGDLGGWVVVVPPDETALGRRGLQRLARGRDPFRLLSAGRGWRVGPRRWWQRW